MPNHVTNIIRIKDLGTSTLNEVHSAILNEERQVDFNKIVESPSCLEDFQPHLGILRAAQRALGMFQKPKREPESLEDLTNSMRLSTAIDGLFSPVRKDDIPKIIQAIQNYYDCGYMYWYDWNLEHWGTKWNAYGQPDEGFSEEATEFKFETAWSHPRNLILKLSKNLPQASFEVRYADEDIGSNCGRYLVKDGVLIEEDIAPRDKMTNEEKSKWAKFAFQINYPDRDPCEFGYGPDWVYSDEIYEKWKLESSNESGGQ